MGPNTIICGLGSIGFRVLMFLEQLGETKISVISLRNHPDWQDYFAKSCAKLFVGDARREELLLQAGVKSSHSIVIATDSDASNISIAFDAIRLNSNIRVVMRLHHQELAQQFREQIPNIEIWNPDSLAAPLFVRASLGQKIIGELHLSRSIELIEEIDLESASSTDLARVSLGDVICGVDQSGCVSSIPDSEVLQLKKFKRLLVCKPIRNADWEKKTISKTIRQFISQAKTLARNFLWNIFLDLRSTTQEFRRLFIAITLVFIISIWIFVEFLKLGIVDAIYFTTTIMTTVGFGDINFLHAPPWLKIYGSMLMIFSVLIVAAIISMISNSLIAAKFTNLIGPKPTPQSPHVIVSGVGALGYRIVKALLELDQIVFAISDGSKDSYTDQLREIVPIIQGKDFDTQLLERAYIHQAKAIIICSSNEIRNLAEGLAAKKANPRTRVIVRTLDIQLARKMDVSLPIDKVLSDSEFSATNFVASIFHRHVLLGLVWENHFLVLKKNKCSHSSLIKFKHTNDELFISIKHLHNLVQ